MLISLKWLKNYVDIPSSITAEDLAYKITMSVVEVEEIIKQGENLENIVVGKILDISNHPDADKLKVVQVDAGRHGILKIVCGGNNLRKDMYVAVALVGSFVKWHGEGELVKIEKAKLRGIESEGMIAAAEEIGLPSGYNIDGGIADLNLDDSYIGKDIKSSLELDDIIFDIDNKSLTNRPDLWGHYGMAREIAAILNLKLKKIIFDEKIINPIDKKLNTDVVIEDKVNCLRYVGIIISNIKVQKSPEWLSKSIENVGIRSINNIVDITNFIMMDLGQPLHAFDISNIEGAKIIVRPAHDKEKFKTLDDQERILTKEDLLICDAKKPIAIAGVMGGLNSEIKNTTTSIFIESANFEASSIRKTSSRLGLRTEASTRFEKSLDPNLTKEAIIRTVELIKKLEMSDISFSKIIDENYSKAQDIIINLSFDEINRKIGIIIDQKIVIDILSRLGFETKAKKNEFIEVKVPSYRAGKDITLPEDLIEEIARIYGYENIKPDLPVAKIQAPIIDPAITFERKLKDFVASDLSYDEVYNYSMISEDDIKNVSKNVSDYIEISNAVSKNIKFLRNDLSSNILKNIRDNLRYFKSFKIFEIGRVFKKEKGIFKADKSSKEFLPYQDKMFAMTMVDSSKDYFDFKGDYEAVLDNFSLNYISKVSSNDLTKQGTMLEYFVNDQSIGFIGEISLNIKNNFDIKENVYYGEFDISSLLKYKREIREYKSLPKYPSIIQDISMVIDYDISWAEIESYIYSSSNMIKEVSIFDIYEGDKIEKEKRSLAFHIVFYDESKTLTSEEVEKHMKKIRQMLTEKFKAKIRE